MKIDTKIDPNEQLPENFDGLKAHVREKAIEIATHLRNDDIPEGSTKMMEAIRRAEEWFTDLEG